MSWVTLSIADIQQKLAGPELTAVNTAVLSSGQASPVTEVIAGVISELRGRLRNRTSLETGATIPQSWVPNAIAVIRYRLCTRLPVKTMANEQRDREYSDAMEAMKQLGPIVPEEPVSIDTAQPSGCTPKIAVHVSQFSRDAQDGL